MLSIYRATGNQSHYGITSDKTAPNSERKKGTEAPLIQLEHVYNFTNLFYKFTYLFIPRLLLQDGDNNYFYIFIFLYFYIFIFLLTIYYIQFTPPPPHSRHQTHPLELSSESSPTTFPPTPSTPLNKPN